MVLQAVEKRPSAVYSGPFTISRACQELLLIRRNGTPHPRPCQSTGQACCSVHRRERFKTVPYKDFGHPRKRDFAGLNLHLGIFDQPEENKFPSLFTPNSLPSPKRFVQAGELITPNCNLLILYICLVVKRIVRVNFKSFIAL